MVGYAGTLSTAMCGQEISIENWMGENGVLSVTLKARDDLIYDGTKVRTVVFYQKDMSVTTGVIYGSYEINRITVCLPD